MKTQFIWVQRIFLACCLIFLLVIFLRSREEILQIVSAATYTPLFVALIVWTLSTFLVPGLALVVLKSRGNAVNFSTLLFIYLNRIPAKYLPGGIWQTFARAYDLSSLGVNKKDIALLVFYENFWSVYVASMLATAGIFALETNTVYVQWTMVLLLAGLCLPPIFFVLRKQDYILPVSAYLKLSAVCILFWLCASFSFLCYLNSLDIMSSNYHPLLLMFHYLFSYVVGFVSIFAPQGIGVFEVVLSQAGSFTIPLEELVVILLGFRFIVLISDLLVWLAYFALVKYKNIASVRQES